MCVVYWMYRNSYAELAGPAGSVLWGSHNRRRFISRRVSWVSGESNECPRRASLPSGPSGHGCIMAFSRVGPDGEVVAERLEDRRQPGLPRGLCYGDAGSETVQQTLEHRSMNRVVPSKTGNIIGTVRPT